MTGSAYTLKGSAAITSSVYGLSDMVRVTFIDNAGFAYAHAEMPRDRALALQERFGKAHIRIA